MSSSSRTTSRGGKGPKADKLHKNDKSDTGKSGGGGEKQSSGGGDTHSANQTAASQSARTASNKSEDPSMREKVRQVMEVSHKTEEEVCLALHECDNDIETAMNMLLDDEWNITVKKRRSKQTSSSGGSGGGGKSGADGTAAADGSADDWNEQISGHHQHGGDKEKPRNKSGGPPRLHGRHNDSRGWRGREKQENERNLEAGQRGDRRGRASRGGPGRGRGGGRAGSRYPPRNNRNFNNSRPIDTWDNNPNTWESHPTGNATENWEVEGHIDEWSTEEYTGSLADTKVFTPSIATDAPADGDPLALAPDGRSPLPPDQQQQQQMMQPPLQQQQGVAQMRPPSPQVPLGALSAAQTQYLSQLTQQNSNEMKPTTYGVAAAAQQQQGSQYGAAAQYGVAPTHNSNAYVNAYSAVTYGAAPDGQPAQQPVRTKTQRARVPPPSKIPSSAVEMPDDLKTIGLLDVQFGALDLISDGMSFDSGVSDSKFNSSGATTNLDSSPSSQPASNLDLSASNQSAASMDGYAAVAQQHQQQQQKTSNAQSSISSALTQNLTNNDNIPQTSEHLTTGYSNATRTSMTGSTTSSGTPSTIELNKQPETHSYSSQSNTYNSYQANKSNYNQTQNYNTPSYSTTQTTTSYGSSQPNSYTTGNSGSSYNAAAAANNAYPNAYSTTSAYQSNAAVAGFPPSITQANSYPSNNQGYSQSASQSVYGANTGLNNSSNYGNATTTPQYSSYSSTTNHKLSKENAYDSSATTASSSSTSTTSVSTASSALSLAQTTATGTKTTTTTLAKNSSGVVSNIPPGVAAPVMSTPYIMSQGIPYFQTPMYTYEDMQLLQQRIPPHMTTPFYEMSYQTPTTLTAVRDAPLSTYAMSDARFTRGDNNASPVPSTLSQQTSTLTQGHQGGQPILAAQAPQGFFYAPYSPMQSYQFGPVYGQIPTATNAHGSSNSTQYTKPSTYSSGYGSTFEVLGQSQDYTKGGYVGNAQGQSKGSGANPSSTGTSGNDLSAMYSKSHTAIGKVNSYDKQGFHSGTPPPFSGALHGSQNAGLTPSGSGYGPQMYIPTMPPHQQHHSTQLMHQPLHQDSGNSGGQRSQASNQAKSGATKFQNAYWNQP